MAARIREALMILRRKQVEIRTGLSGSTIYQGVADGTFPAPISLGPRAVGWIESEVDDWLAAKVNGTRSLDAATAAAARLAKCPKKKVVGINPTPSASCPSKNEAAA